MDPSRTFTLTEVLRRQSARRLPCPRSGCPGKLIIRRGQGRWFWGCTEWPECRETHGAHQATGDPLGTPADSATRRARMAAHEELQRLAVVLKLSRGGSYRWLARAMGLSERDCHIGKFDQSQCVQAVALMTAGIDDFHRTQAEQIAELEALRQRMQKDLAADQASEKKDSTHSRRPTQSKRVWGDDLTGKRRRVLLED